MKKDILIIAHFVGDFDTVENNRFNYLARLLKKQDYNVELLTSNFSHTKKEKRNTSYTKDFEYKITYIEEPKYNNNISLKRLYSHKKMAYNIKKYFKHRETPDLIYCAVPSLSIAKEAATFAKKNNIKFIIDIQDVWPEAFELIFNLPIVSDLIYYPMKKTSRYIYALADEIISVSKTYGNIALKYNEKCKNTHNIFLGTELKRFDKNYNNDIKPDHEMWLGYVGTLGHSYDITIIINALALLKEKGITNLKFMIMGDGPLKQKFENYASKKGVYYEFTGRLGYDEMVKHLTNCDIVVNPISKGAAQSIINKHADYAASGLPVISTQDTKEYKEIVEQYNIGFNCDSNDAKELASKILKLYNNRELRMTMGNNHRLLAEKKFDRKTTYKKIIQVIQNTIDEKGVK